MKKTIAKFFLALMLVAPIVLGVWWLFWQLWMWVLPQLWPTAPGNLAKPSYWLFVGAVLMLGYIGRLLSGSKSQ